MEGNVVSGGRKGGKQAQREREHSRCSHILVIYTIIAYSSRIRVCHLFRQFASLEKAGNISTSQKLQSCNSSLTKSLFDTV